MAQHKVVVVGGGITGMAAAALAASDGADVTLLEKNQRLGGRIDGATIDGFRFECGPSWCLMPEVYIHLLRALGLEDDAFGLTRLDPAYRVITDAGRQVDVRTGYAPELFDAVEPGSGERLRRYLARGRELYRLAERYLLATDYSRPRDFARILRPPVLRRLPELIRLLSRSLDRVTADVARDPLLRHILEYPAVFLSAAPHRIPAAYQLMSHADLELGVYYPTGGFDAIVSLLARILAERGVRVRVSCPATRIVSAGGRVVAVESAEGRYPADAVIATADLRHVETDLVTPRDRTFGPRFWRRRDPGISAVVVLLGVRGRVPELAHHTLILSEDWSEDFAAVAASPRRPGGPASDSIYVCRPSATDPAVAPEGCENLFVLVPTAASTAIGHGDLFGHAEDPAVARIASRTVAIVERRIGRRLDVAVRRTVGPADYATRYRSDAGAALGPAHTAAQTAVLRGRMRSRRVSGLVYAGSTGLPGVGIPMCLLSAETAWGLARESVAQ